MSACFGSAGCLPAPRDEQIVWLTMLIQGARNLSACLSFSCHWGRKCTGTPRTEDWPEELWSGIPGLNSALWAVCLLWALLCQHWDPAPGPVVTKSPPSHAPACQQNPPWLQRISASFTAELAGPDHHISGLHSQNWSFCELEIKAQLPESGQLSCC